MKATQPQPRLYPIILEHLLDRKNVWVCHGEERSDEAISMDRAREKNCFAEPVLGAIEGLAMTFFYSRDDRQLAGEARATQLTKSTPETELTMIHPIDCLALNSPFYEASTKLSLNSSESGSYLSKRLEIVNKSSRNSENGEDMSHRPRCTISRAMRA